jgi:hypothetical protein
MALASCPLKTNERENSNVQKFLMDLHNNPYTFFKSSGTNELNAY